jgi:hypothetical protein
MNENEKIALLKSVAELIKEEAYKPKNNDGAGWFHGILHAATLIEQQIDLLEKGQKCALSHPRPNPTPLYHGVKEGRLFKWAMKRFQDN